MAEYYSIIYIHHIFFIFPHLDCFQVLVIVNSDVMNVGELYLFDLVFFFLLVRYPEAKLLNCMVVLLLVLFRNHFPYYISTNSAQGSLFHIFANICYLVCFFQ